MASANVTTGKVKKVVEVDGPAVVTLTLSEKEAFVVKFLVGRTGGTSDFRQTCSRVWGALEEAGVDKDDAMYFYNKNYEGVIVEPSKIEFPPGLANGE